MIVSDVKSRNIPFPKLMEYDSIGQNAVFYAEDEENGFCLRSNCEYKVGKTYKINGMRPQIFHDFRGILELKNEY